jgi:hypothetical protein
VLFLVFYKIGSVEAALFTLAVLPGIICLIAGQRSTAETADIANSSIHCPHQQRTQHRSECKTY